MVKIYEVAYSEHTVHHKRFEAESQDEAIAMASKDVEKHFWDVSKAKGWEHGSGEGGHFEVVDELDKDEDLDDEDLDDDEDEEEEDAVRD